MITLTAKKWGNGLGLRLDKQAREMLGGLEEDDTLYLVQTENGLQITPYDPTFAEQIELAQKVMKKRRNALRALAK